VTVNADVGAVVEINASSYVSVNNVPAVFVTADENTGARKSGATEELLIAAKPDTVNMSLPVMSCMAAFEIDKSSNGAVYDTLTVWFDVIVTPESRKVSVLLKTALFVQLMLNPAEIVADTPLTRTPKSDVAAVVHLTASLKSKLISVPDDVTVAVEMVGRMVSTVELLVTDLAAKESASFPAVSCTAGFVIAEFDVGAVYATVNTLSFATTEANVKTTVALVPGAETDEIVTGVPATVTTKSSVVAVVDLIVSLYVKVKVVPLVPRMAVLRTGPIWSTVEPFVTVVAENDAASLPVVS